MNHNFYSAPSAMVGGYIVYGGYRRQRGAGFNFGSIRNQLASAGRFAGNQLASAGKFAGRHALQGIKSVARNKVAQNIAKNVAKTAAVKGAEVLTGVAVDALQGRDAGESFREHSKQVAIDTLTGKTNLNEESIKRNKRKRKRKPVISTKGLKQSPKQVPAPTIASNPTPTPVVKKFERIPRKKRRLF